MQRYSIFVFFFLFPCLNTAMIPLYDTLQEHKAFLHVVYSSNNKHYQLNAPFEDWVVTDGRLAVERSLKPTNTDTFEIEYSIQSNTDDVIKLHQFEVMFVSDLTNNSMLAEGFQCWSQTREMDRTSSLSAIPSTVAWITKFDLQGDYNFFKHSGKKGMIHSVGYTHLRDNNDDTVLFVGSLSEHNGYSYFRSNFSSHGFNIYKDIEGKTLPSRDQVVFGYFATKHHNQQSVWQRYADRFLPSIKKETSTEAAPTLTGWTSWYNFYEAVTEKDVVESITGFANHGYPVDLIQIDDGYETAIGDWLDVDVGKFPNGMKFLADQIKQQTNDRAIAGIWLAPFAVGLNSKINKEHPDWLVYQPDGNPLLAGPNWGGFRALDIYHPEVRDYLQQVFDTVIDDWGYKFLKLDFIFAAAILPRQGKSRGEVMWDAVTLIEELTRRRAILLGSGVTLPSAWGRMDYCRVSSDASPWWDHSILKMANVRERVATYNALVSTLNRWPMNNIMFGNDPDVFFIRSNNNKLTADERHTLVVINNILGQMALMSDNVARYSKEEHDLYAKTFPKVLINMERMDRIGPDVYQLQYLCNGRPYITVTNISPLPHQFLLPTSSVLSSLPSNDLDSMTVDDAFYFEYKNVLLKGNRRSEKITPVSVQWIDATLETPLTIQPHQTRTFMRIVDDFAGSTGHIIPGWEVESITRQGAYQDLMYIKLRQPRPRTTTAQFYFKSRKTEAASGDDDSMEPKVFIDNKKIIDVQELSKENSGKQIPFSMLQLTYSP